MSIPAQQARGIYTKAFTAVYEENIPAPQFLKSFFPSMIYNSATVNIEVSRGNEKIAVDVIRGTRGKRNTFSRATQKEILPPFYKEYFDATQLDNYDRVFGFSPDIPNATVIGFLARETGMKYVELRKKIDRAKELQCANALETGVVTLVNGDNIDYKRQATSIVDLTASGYWTNTGADVESQLIAAAEFERQEGRNSSAIFNLVTSGQAFVNLKKTDFFKNNANYQQVKLIDINTPIKESFGAAYHGQISAGAYIFNIWTYDETYETDAGVATRYWPVNKAVIIPTTGARFEMSHAQVPAIIRDTGNAEFPAFIGRVSAEYYRTNSIDELGAAHYFWLMSAPVAFPITVDMIYTMQIAGDSEIQGG